VQLAEVLAAKRNLTAARAEVEEACRLEPRLAGAHLMRALILLSDKDPLGAIQAADSALRYDRTLAQAEYIKANALIETRQYDEALSSLETSVRQNPMLGGAQTHSMRGRIYFKQRKVKQSYGEFLVAQRLSGRAVRLAPLMAAVAMVLSVFGTNAPFVLAGVLAAVVALILWGVSHIPVAGPWIAVALLIAIVGFFAFAGVRQIAGRVLPSDPSARATAIAAIGFALIAGTGIVLFIERALAGAMHQAQWFTPLTMTVAGVIGMALGGLAAYAWPRVLGRFGAAGGAKA
jgi:tetratricopeptide (TPR) repeat protein